MHKETNCRSVSLHFSCEHSSALVQINSKMADGLSVSIKTFSTFLNGILIGGGQIRILKVL